MARSAMEAAICAAFEEGRAAWPGVTLDEARFARCLSARAGEDARPEALGALRIADLYLACACAEGVPAAIEAFDREFLAAVPAYVASIDGSAAFGDEVRQILRARLLLAEPGGEPRIAGYGGRGALSGWVRVAATRVALNLRRDTRRAAGDDDVAQAAAGSGGDPELGFLKARYRGAFEEALREALAALPAHQRALLRLSLVEGLGLEAIGAVYQVHLSTISRRLARARAAIAEGTHQRLAERLRLSASEIESLEGLVLSQLDVGISSLLRSRDDL